MAWSIAWLEQSMRWVLMTPLGTPVEPEVNSSLATVSGPGSAPFVALPAAVVSRSSSLSAPSRSPRDTSARGTAGESASRAAPNGPASSANTSPGRVSSAIALIRAWSALISEYATLIGITGTHAA